MASRRTAAHRSRTPGRRSSSSTAAARRRRDAAPLESEERAAAMEEIGRIEVHIARIERAMDPPLG